MTEKYSREILRRNVAQICQTIGWSGITATPLDILVHVLELYIRNLGARSSRYAEQFNRTQPNLHDLGLVFRDLHINLPELHDFTKCVPPVPPPVSTERYPKPKESNLNFLKPGSHEVVTRPMHVYDYLPPMYPDKERDQPTLVADTIEIQQNGLDTTDRALNTCSSPEISVTDSPEKQKDIFKRPIDPVGMPSSKRQRLRLEDEDCRTREIKSVMMTMSGFLSPAREGKLPEAKTPAIIYDKHDKQKPMTNSNLIKVPATMQSSEKNDKKSKKNKSVNGKVMKNKKRDKTHKSDNKHKPDKVDKQLPGFPIRPKDMHSQNHIGSSFPMSRPHTNLPVPKPVTIKQEPLDHSQFPSPPIPKESPRAVHLDNIPVPKRIPKSQSPLVPNNLHTHRAPAPASSSSLIPQDQIKKEPMEEEEKLASQPDRSKINIFKRISNKSKEDKNLSEVVPEKTDQISRLNASHSLSENRNSVGSSAPIEIKTEPTSKNGEINNMGVFKTPDLTANEVISIDDDSMEYNPSSHRTITPPTIRKDLFESPKIMPRKMDELLASTPNASSSKVKKEKKHKDKKDKLSMEKAVKMLRKQQLAYEMAMQHSDKSNIPFPVKTPRSRASKGESKIPQMPPGFPFFPSMPGRGLMPGPGLIPNPGLIPGADLNLLASLNNPALRGLTPNNLMANPYALPVGGPGLIPGPNFMPGGSGMIPQNLPNHIMQMANAGQSSRSAKSIHPLLRRPSLEVIPVDDDNRKAMIHESPLREKERHDKHKMSSIPNILQKHAHKSKAKSNPLSKMPFIQPDVTIELNPPKRDPPNIPVPVLVPVKKEPREPVPPLVEQPKEIPTSSSPELLQDSLPSEPETSSSIVSKDKSEKKKDKLHKKEKRDKDGIKIKKKKDKKDKSKHKSEKSKEKEGSVDKELKDKIKKEKKEKKKDKEKQPVEAIVPKLTLKLGSASPMPPSSPEVFKLNIKPVVKKDPDTPKENSPEPSRSPEVAQFAALVTRPPKQKHSKSNHVSPEEPKSSTSHTDSGSSPTRKNKPPGSIKKTKLFFKAMAKKGKVSDGEDTDLALITEDSTPQAKVDKKPMQLSTPYYTDEHGNKVWVCPACGTPDNGSPMIGCDGCDGWYHWVCVGITKDPGSTEDWFCKSCIAKRTAMATALAGGIMSGKKRGRKSKTDKP